MSFHQDGPVHRPAFTFATHTPLLSLVRLLDNFTEFSALYEWHVNNQSVTKATTTPNFTVVFNQTGPQYLGVKVTVKTNITNPSGGVETVTRSREYKEYLELRGGLIFSKVKIAVNL